MDAIEKEAFTATIKVQVTWQLYQISLKNLKVDLKDNINSPLV